MLRAVRFCPFGIAAGSVLRSITTHGIPALPSVAARPSPTGPPPTTMTEVWIRRTLCLSSALPGIDDFLTASVLCPAWHCLLDGLAESRAERADRRVAVGAGAHAGRELAVRTAGQGADAGRRRRDSGEQQSGDQRGRVSLLGQVDLEQQVGPRVTHVGFEARGAAPVAGPLAGRGGRRVEDPGHVREVG